MSYTVAQNTSFLTIASVAQKIISGVYFFIVSWFVKEGKTETYFAIFAAIAIFTVIADFGLGNTFTREISQKPEKTERYLQVVFLTKVLLGLGTIALLIFSSLVFNYPSENIYLILVAGATLFFDSLRNIFYGVLRARNNLKYEACGTVAAQGITLVIGTIALVLRAELIWLIIPFLISSIVHTTYAIWCVHTKTNFRFTWGWDTSIVRAFILLSLPFAVAGLFTQLYSYQDSIFIKEFLPEVDGDNWARAYKAAFVFQFIPTSLVASLYPRISLLYVQKDFAMQKLVLGSYRYVLLVAVPLAFGTAVFAPAIIERFVHRFSGAVPIFQILIFSAIFNFASYIHLTVLNATRRQTLQTIFMGITLILSIILNSLIIPEHGTRGAAVVAVVSSAFLFILGYRFTQKVVAFTHTAFLKLIAQFLLPGIVMYIMGNYFVVRSQLLPGIALGGLVYIGGIFMSGGLSVKTIKQSLEKIFSFNKAPSQVD